MVLIKGIKIIGTDWCKAVLLKLYLIKTIMRVCATVYLLSGKNILFTPTNTN